MTFGALALALLLVVVILVRAHRLEERFLIQGREMRAVGEATERLAAKAPAIPDVDELPKGVKFRHPEAPNLLVAKDTHWPPEGAATNGVLFRSFEYGDPKGFNLLFESSGILEDRIYAYCRLRLAERNSWTNPDRYYGTLAFRIEVTSDSREFTAYLRPGVRWHPASGVNLDASRYAWLRGDKEVTARDLAFTLDLITNPQVQAGTWKSYYAGIESYEAVDDHTFVVRWKKKEYSNAIATLSLWATPRFLYAHDEDGKPFPKETLGLRVNQHWYDNKDFVGAGPYRMASYEPGSKIVLERNEGYPGERPAIQKLVYPIYTDAKQTLLKLRAGELGDGELTAGQYREEILAHEKAGKAPAQSPFFDGRIQCQKIPRPAYSFIAWNAARPMFADKRVRRAMTHALDRQRIIDNVYVGLGAISTGPYPPGSPNADPAIKPIPFDLATARKLLAEAGWTDTDGDGLVDRELHPGDKKRSPFEFRLSFAVGQSETDATVKIFADELSKIGIRAILDPQEWALLQKRKDERQYDAYLGSRMTPWFTDLYQVWHSSQADLAGGSNAVSFKNQAADAIIEKLRVAFDEDERVRLFRAFHRIVDEEQPYAFVMVRSKVHCAWSSVKNVIYAKDTSVENSLPWWVESTRL
jgi:ABC-type transport system substrate-binding protein